MKPDFSRRTGVIQILLSGFCFGFLGLFGKLAFAEGVTPGELLSLRFLLGSLLLTIFYLVTAPKKLLIPAKSIFYCLLLGVFGYALFSSFYFIALHGLSASLTVLLLYMYPVLVALGGWILYKEKIPKERFFALPLALIGLCLLVAADFEVSRMSAFMAGLGAALFYAIYILASRKWLEDVDALVSVAYIQGFAGLILAALYWRDFSRFGDVVVVAWPMILGLAVVCSILAMALFQTGLKKLKSWEASLLSTVEPVMGILIAILLLNERLTIWQTLGGVLVLGALVSVSIPVKNKN